MNKIIFLDFDGVIKESLAVKTNAFVKLFEPFGTDIAERVRKHHLDNGGMSRYEKFPIYFSWAKIVFNSDLVNNYSEQFNKLTFKGIVDCDWVPGVKEYIIKNHTNAFLIVVSATPKHELENILIALDIRTYFTEVFGAPASKKESIRDSLLKYKIESKKCLMIGDDKVDMDAADYNNVPFLLRLHNTNKELFEKYFGESIKDFKNL